MSQKVTDRRKTATDKEKKKKKEKEKEKEEAEVEESNLDKKKTDAITEDDVHDHHGNEKEEGNDDNDDDDENKTSPPPFKPIDRPLRTPPKLKTTTIFNCTNISWALALFYLATTCSVIYRLWKPDLTPSDPREVIFRPRWQANQKFALSLFLAPVASSPSSSSPSSSSSTHTWPSYVQWGNMDFSTPWTDTVDGDIKRADILYAQDLNLTHTQYTWDLNISSSLLRSPINNQSMMLYVCIHRSGFACAREGVQINSHRQGTDVANKPDLSPVIIAVPITHFASFTENATRNLLSGEEPINMTAEELAKRTKIVTYWKKRLPIKIVNQHLHFPQSKVPREIGHIIMLDQQKREYGPIVVSEDAWVLKSETLPLNSSTTTLPLSISIQPSSLGWVIVSQQLQRSLEMISQFTGEEDADEVKQLFGGTNPILLAVTIVVSVFHMLFDFLAFKNEISFWKNRKSFVGLSGRTLMIDLVSKGIIFLYLVDQDSSKIVLVSALAELAINTWKIARISRVSIGWKGRIPTLIVGTIDQRENDTKSYDTKAMKYMFLLLLPLVIGSAIWSLFHSTHKTWYSWVLSSFASAMYVGGFVMMTPQLFINYKMKSVSHLPWRVFIYKALNTFIDDLFAFIIVMPTMHRLSVFRDDIVFFVYLYQRWIYPVDKNRQEYGDDDD